MKIQISSPQKILLSDLDGLAPIGVILEDYRPGQGRITITYSDSAWTKFLLDLGEMTVKEYFCSAGNNYLANKLSKPGDDLRQLTRIISIVATALEAKEALEIAITPLPDTAPNRPIHSSSITPDII